MEKNVISIIVAAGKNLSNAGYSLLASIIIAFFHFLLILGIKNAGEAAALTFFFGILYLICTIIIISSLLSAGKNLSSLPIQSHQSDKLVKSSSITEINTTKSGEYFAGGIIVYTDTDGNHGLMCSEKELGKSNWNSAHSLCKKHRAGDHTDWSLPTDEELDLIHKILFKEKKLRIFSKDGYWSLSEYSTQYAWRVFIVTGTKYGYSKSNLSNVRAVRHF